MLRVTTTDTKVWVEAKAFHNPDSHGQETLQKLHTSQKAAVIKAVQADPSLSSTAIRRAVTLSTVIPPALNRSVTYLVRKQRKQVISNEFNGITLDGTTGSFHALKDSIWFKTALERLRKLFYCCLFTN